MRPLTRTIFLGGCLHAVLMSVQINAQAPSVSEAGQAEINAYLEQVVSDTWIPGVVAMVTNGEGVIYAGAFGSQDVAQARPMTVDSIPPRGSAPCC